MKLGLFFWSPLRKFRVMCWLNTGKVHCWRNGFELRRQNTKMTLQKNILSELWAFCNVLHNVGKIDDIMQFSRIVGYITQRKNIITPTLGRSGGPALGGTKCYILHRESTCCVHVVLQAVYKFLKTSAVLLCGTHLHNATRQPSTLISPWPSEKYNFDKLNNQP